MKRQLASRSTLLTTLAGLMILPGVASADGGADHKILRTRPIDLGVSGVNREDFCFVRGGNFVVCSTGTLGSLVEDAGGTLYILSCNHVLAELNQSAIGDDVIQPGYLDDCFNQNPSANVVADLSDFVTLDFSGADNLADAAIAEIRAGEVDSSGTILDIGSIGTSTAAAFVGQAVKKSGRTTGLTNGTVATINVTVNVGYLACGAKQNEGQTGHFVDQIEITPGSFSSGGDSGSLIVESATDQAVGMLFAGSSFSTIANSIDNVLCAFSSPLAMAGGTPNCAGGCTGPGDCNAGEICCNQACVTAVCSADGDCDDADPCNGSETCSNPGTCNASCDAGTPPGCVNGDGCCPAGCDNSNDDDCPVAGCGDGVCAGGGVEDCFSCPADCRCAGGPNCNACCGDGVCGGPGESASNCPVDCGGAAANGRAIRGINFAQAAAIKRRNSAQIFAASPLVVGHGIGADDKGAPVIVVFLERESAPARAQIPAAIEGLPTRVKVTGPFMAYGCR